MYRTKKHRKTPETSQEDKAGTRGDNQTEIISAHEGLAKTAAQNPRCRRLPFIRTKNAIQCTTLKKKGWDNGGGQ